MTATLKCPRCESDRVSAHATPLPAKGEADVWSPVREEGYWCHACDLKEESLNNAKRAYRDFRSRWNDAIEVLSPVEYQVRLDQRNRIADEQAREWTWPDESRSGVHDRAWRAAQLAEREAEQTYAAYSALPDGTLDIKRVGPLPVNRDIFNNIVGHPDDDLFRVRYAEWLRMQNHPMAVDAASFIEEQLRLAASFRTDPKVDAKAELPTGVFSPREVEATDLPDQEWWRFPRSAEVGRAFCDFTAVLRDVGLIDDERSYRGFVEHVAIKASRFLEIADELYSLAPIRLLTITYCKGTDHQDAQLLEQLLASPHLDRIRAIKLPVRKFGWDKGDVTELNRLTDGDVKRIARSKHLSKLAYLDLEDQRLLTIDAFDALATSPNLPTLSAVRHDINRYWYPGTFSFGTVGKQLRELQDRPLGRYAPILERARGSRIPWLHIANNYGTEAPDPEAVIAHPIAHPH